MESEPLTASLKVETEKGPGEKIWGDWWGKNIYIWDIKNLFYSSSYIYIYDLLFYINIEKQITKKLFCKF